MEEQNLYGQLFGKIPLYNKSHIDSIINTIDENMAVYYLTQAVSHAFDSGIYTLGESEIISKSIRILMNKENSEENTEE